MKENNLLQIKFGSFIKLFSSIFFSLGSIIGVLAFIISLFDENVTASIGSVQFTGILAGLASLVIFPIFFYLI